MIKEAFKELMNLELYEEEQGFILFRIEGKFVYIHLMYVKPEHRKSHYAKTMADKLCKTAKEAFGCTHLKADIQPSNRTANLAMKVLLAYGMEIREANHDEIILIKEIE
jgi:hypothetical protein